MSAAAVTPLMVRNGLRAGIKELAAMLGIDYLRPLDDQDPKFISVLLYG